MFWLSVTNTLFYTAVATVGKFGLGLWLALLLNQHIPFKSLIRAIVLVPWIVPTVLSAIAFWWIYDPQFSIISYALKSIGLIHDNIDFLGTPVACAAQPDRGQYLARHPVRGDQPARRAADDLALAVRGGAAGWGVAVAALHPRDRCRC